MIKTRWSAKVTVAGKFNLSDSLLKHAETEMYHYIFSALKIFYSLQNTMDACH